MHDAGVDISMRIDGLASNGKGERSCPASVAERVVLKSNILHHGGSIMWPYSATRFVNILK